MLDDRFRAGKLFEASPVHHHDPLPQIKRLVNVVGNKEKGLIGKRSVEVFDFLLQINPG